MILFKRFKHVLLPFYNCFKSQISPNHQLLLQTTVRMKTHTTKGWKTIAVTGQKFKVKTNIEETPVSIEEGKEAVLHSQLITQLQKCKSIPSQIETFCSLVSLSAEDIEKRKLFCESLEDVLKIYFTNFKLHQFGSSVNGLGFKGCDMDLCFQTLFNNEEYVTIKDVPTLDSVKDGSVSQETLSRLTPMFMLRFVRRILRLHSPDVKEPILFIKARCPIIRFYNAKYDVFCDFSIESEYSLLNTKLIRLVSHLDEKFKVLAKVIRYWGKYGGFVADIDTFNSYSFSLFVIYFLQKTNPPILPSVKEMLEKSDYLRHADVGDVETLMKDLKNFQPSSNTADIEQLLKEFFFYYLKFDFERVIRPYSSSTIHKNDFVLEDNPDKYFGFGIMSIQDPFQHPFNCTGTVSYKNCLRFISNLIQTCEAYQDEEIWIPGNDMWGLCSLFKPPANEAKLSKQRQQIQKHFIKLPVKPGAKTKLKNILEHGLLFNCKELRVFDSEENEVFKLQCKIYRDTWHGRDEVVELLSQDSDILENEHLISKEVLKNRTELKRELLADLLCVCREVKTENEVSLVLDLDFRGVKYPYVLALFLKEYIPNVYNKL